MYTESAVSVRPGPPPAIVQPLPEDLIRTHAKLVHRLARQVYAKFSTATAIEDLVQIGQIALIESARAFVDRGEATFSTYATLRVRGAMIDTLRKSATITRDSMRRRRQFDHARQTLQASLGRPPTDVEMAGHVDMAVESYRSAKAATNSIQYSSIDDSYSDHNASYADETPNAFEILDSARERTAVANAIKTLPHREQVVLQLYFVDECSLEEIGKIFSVGPARVCQIKKVALEKLRTLLRDHGEAFLGSMSPRRVAPTAALRRHPRSLTQ